jgi:DNA-binding NarL/FixJ family response regulator
VVEALRRRADGRALLGPPDVRVVPEGWPSLLEDTRHGAPPPPAHHEIGHDRGVWALAAAVGEAFSSIAVVEDHALVADALVDAMVGLGLGAWTVPITTREALLGDLAAQRPGAVILDLTLGGDVGDATDLIPLIRRLGITVAVATGDVRRLTAARCYEAGACVVVTKGEPFRRLLEQLAVAAKCERCITDNEYYELVQELRGEREAQREAMARFARLTPREADVLEHMCDGCSIAETAEIEYVAETTVRSHIRSIFLKLDVRTQLAAAAAAHRTGWIVERRKRQSSGRTRTNRG